MHAGPSFVVAGGRSDGVLVDESLHILHESASAGAEDVERTVLQVADRMIRRHRQVLLDQRLAQTEMQGQVDSWSRRRGGYLSSEVLPVLANSRTVSFPFASSRSGTC